MSDKLDEIKKRIEEIQAKSAVASEMKAFVALVVAYVKKNKDEFADLSAENLQTIKDSIAYIEDNYTKWDKSLDTKINTATGKFERDMALLKGLIEKVKTVKPKDGVDGKDADETKIVEDVLSKIKLPEYELFTLDEKGEQIVKEINELPTDDDDLKIDAKHIKNLPKSLGGGNSHAVVRSIALNDLTDVIADNPSTGQALIWNGANWINDNVSGGSGGGATLFKALTPDEDGTYPLLQGAIDGVNTLYTVPEGQYITGTLTVWLNGVVVDPGTGSDEWQETDPVTGTFTFNTAPQSSTNDSVYVEYNTTAGGGGGNAAGSDTQVQFNDAGALNGDSTFTFNKTTNVLTADTLVVADEAYSGSWDGSLEVPTKNALWDKIETIVSTPAGAEGQLQYNDGGVFGAISLDNAFFDDTAPMLYLLDSTTTYFKEGNYTTGFNFNADSITSSTIRTYVAPNADGTLALTSDIPDALTDFTNNGNWKVFYSNGSGDVVELALGADGTFLKSNGAAVAPSFATPAGSGDVSKVGTPVNNQLGVWTGDGTIEGDADLTFDTTTNTLAIGTGILTADTITLTGTGTLNGVDAIDATTEATIEAAIDTLSNLTSVQGHTVTLTGAFIRVGAHSLTLTTGATTDVTLPASGTLAVLGGDVWTGVHDFGGATSLEVPNGAGGTTLNDAGEICVDTTSDTLNFYDGTLEAVLTPIMSKSITIESPTASEDISMFYSDEAITITKIVFVITGSTSVTTTIRQGTDRSAAGTEVVTGGTTANSTTTGNVVTSFNDATVPADSFIWLETTSLSGTPTSLSCTIFYRQDA